MARYVKSNKAAANAIADRAAFSNRNRTFFGESFANGNYAVYSYGYHWPLAVYLAKDDAWVVNDEYYSATTSKHLSIVRRAITAGEILTDRTGIGAAENDIFKPDHATGFYLSNGLQIRKGTELWGVNADVPEACRIAAINNPVRDLIQFPTLGKDLWDNVISIFTAKKIKRFNRGYVRLAA